MINPINHSPGPRGTGTYRVSLEGVGGRIMCQMEYKNVEEAIKSRKQLIVSIFPTVPISEPGKHMNIL